MTHTYPLAKRIGSTAFAFRGYDLTNLGRTPELLVHSVYGPMVETVLVEASKLCSDIFHRRVDLFARVRDGRETVNLDDYGEDVALIVAAEMAQVKILQEVFDTPVTKCRLAFGYSLGEVAALIAGGVFHMNDLLRVPLALADDAVALAEDVSLGVLFSRGVALDRLAVKRLCLEINQDGHGLIDISAHLSPNSLLLLGQNNRLELFQKEMGKYFNGSAHLRKKPHRWPPMHTIITRQRSIPDRAAVLLESAPGGLQAPQMTLLSGVTGKGSYTDTNSRELIRSWIDHPQQLWAMVHETLTSGVEAVIHVGPAPNIIPATFKRLSDDVRGQIEGYSPGRLGMRAMSQLARRPWLSQLLPTATTLLRAPFVQHINLEDWLLEQLPQGN